MKLRTPRASLVRRPHAAEQLAQPSPTPIRAPRLRRSRAPGLSPERLRVGSRPVRGRCAAARRRHLRDDARGVRHRRRVRSSGAAAGIRTAALVPVPVSCPHRPADSGRRPRRPWGGRDGGQVVIEIHVQRLERGFRRGRLRVRRHRWHRRPDTLRPLSASTSVPARDDSASGFNTSSKVSSNRRAQQTQRATTTSGVTTTRYVTEENIRRDRRGDAREPTIASIARHVIHRRVERRPRRRDRRASF